MHKGWDSFTPAPGEWQTCKCRICNAEMNVKRNQLGPRSWVESAAKIEVPYDHFYCPHIKEEWHIKALEVSLELQETRSSYIRTILQQEIIDLVKGRSSE
jgi:hypothetical protein